MNHNGQVAIWRQNGTPVMVVRWYNGAAWYSMPGTRIAVPNQGVISLRDWRGNTRILV